MRRRQQSPWQQLAWKHYDAIGEVKYAFNYFANVLSRVRLYAAYSPDDRDGPPVPIGSLGNVDRDLVTAARYEVAKLDTAHGGQAGLMRAFALNLSVAGDCYLIEQGQQMSVNSSSEVRVMGTASATSSGIKLVPSQNSLMNEWIDLPQDAFIARVWRPHPAWSDEPDSSLLGVREAAEELLLLSRLIRSSAMASINNGILYVAEELSFERAADVSTQPEEDDPDNPDQGDEDAFEEEFNLHMTEPVDDDMSAAAILPLLVRGPYDMAENAIRKIDLNRPFDEQAVKLRETALERVLNGLDIPKDLVTGLQNVRFSNGQQITENMYKAHIEPMAVLICEALTVTRLRPALLERGVDPDKVARATIWYDASEVTVTANRAQDADAGHDRLLISDAAWRRDHGYSDADKPDDEELARRMAEKAPMDPTVAIQLLSALMPAVAELMRAQTAGQNGGQGALPPGGGNVLDLPPGQQTQPGQPLDGGVPEPADSSAPLPPPNGTPAPAGVVAAAKTRREPVGTTDVHRLVEIERNLRASLQTMLTDMTERALEKAGSRLTSKVRDKPELVAKIRNVPKAQVAAVLGRDALTAAGYTDHQIVNDSIDQAGSKYKQQLKQAQLQATRIVGEQFLNDGHIDESWSVLKPLLVAFVLRALFRKQEGGYIPKVPMDDVRAALARAGGHQPKGPAKEGRLQPGAVLNDRAIALLSDKHNAELGGYRWLYGISDNHFQPHLDLDGKEFSDWTDEVLRNPNPAFPKVEHFYPGDHAGCECDWLPVLFPRIDHEGEIGGKTLTREQSLRRSGLAS